MKGRVLIIAGSDPSGGAGVQADIKTVTALGGYAASAITALTVQNTLGVSAVHPVEPALIRAQAAAALEDIGADAVKIGMIGEESAALEIVLFLREFARETPLILDPVLSATSGDPLAGEGVADVILNELVPLAAVVTPNSEEAAALTGLEVKGRNGLIAAGEALVAAGADAALVKGGHIDGDTVDDALVTAEGARVFSNPRLDIRAAHGTGCTLASAIATGIAQGLVLQAAVKRAIDYVQKAIKTAPDYGAGGMLLNHAHTLSVHEEN
ncbi:MAG: bifunctional hydroxymethylpyrimidine kinase/phosphomethylpyrimidine kinase [Parvularculaceae bacterium]